jgi:putative hydrolase of the HAD superfamily
MKKAIAFDLGNVVFDFDYRIALEKIKHKINVPCERIINDLFFNNFATDFEKGIISSYDFYLKFKNTYSASLTYEEFKDTWSKIFYPRQEIVDLIERLNLVYPVYLISNINELHFQYLHHTYPYIFSLFDNLILSFKLKAVKPEKRIYEELKNVSQLEYNDIIYIDDREDLIKEAQKLNLICIKFTDIDQLLKDLNSFSIVVPNEEEKNTFLFLKRKISVYKNPLILGLGNLLRSDDGVGVKIIQDIKDKIYLKTLNAESSIENYLEKIKKMNIDFLLIIDAGNFFKENKFYVFSPQEIESNTLYFTHNTSLKLTIQYLQKEKTFDILILGIKAKNCSLGEKLSKLTEKAKVLIENFFLKNFPLKTKCVN